MRREIFRMDRAEALGLLRRAPFVHLSAVGAEGQPILRTLSSVVVDDWICFHSARAGEKAEAVGTQVVVGAEEVVASIPSYFVDPQSACTATQLARSVQVHGVLEPVEEPTFKARALQALMERLQPEGGHVPVAADHDLYRGEIKGVLVTRVSLDRLDGKAKLAQNKPPEERSQLVQRLWERGAPGDARAVELVLRANPDTPPPPFLRGPEGLRLIVQLEPEDVEEAVALIRPGYWNVGWKPEAIARALLGSSAWIGARDGAGRLVGHARALSDNGKRAWIYDVYTADDWRGRGVGKALMRLLLDHPAVRHAETVWLDTRDAQGLYARFGFREEGELPKKPYPSVRMGLLRRSS